MKLNCGIGIRDRRSSSIFWDPKHDDKNQRSARTTPEWRIGFEFGSVETTRESLWGTGLRLFLSRTDSMSTTRRFYKRQSIATRSNKRHVHAG
ncbi:hypothetical protein L484_014927 [Morus notabilis]|uniref:Uncharacterized protein n=1 Tax=Morus notabilis TaxID=981085 RepID=W9RMH6_9ROSA|nr:hypothetical protein L484_014927 [Morus notabilis]